MASKLTLHQGHDLPDDVIDVERDLLNVSLFRKRPDAPDYLIRPIAVVNYPFYRAARRGQIGGLAIEPAQSRIGVSDHRSERLVNFMSDGGRQFAQRCHPRDVREFHSRGVKLLLGLFGRSDIHHRPNELQLVRLISDSMSDDMNVFD